MVFITWIVAAVLIWIAWGWIGRIAGLLWITIFGSIFALGSAMSNAQDGKGYGAYYAFIAVPIVISAAKYFLSRRSASVEA